MEKNFFNRQNVSLRALTWKRKKNSSATKIFFEMGWKKYSLNGGSFIAWWEIILKLFLVDTMSVLYIEMNTLIKLHLVNVDS